MIRPAQVALVERARAALRERTDVLAVFPAAEKVPELSPARFNALLDTCTVSGFRDRRRPILARKRLAFLDDARRHLVSDFAWKTSVRSHCAPDLRDLDGSTFLKLLAWLERFNPALPDIAADLGEVTVKQAQLVHIAAGKVNMNDGLLAHVLQFYGAVNSASDLDGRGFDLVMAVMAAHGFERRMPGAGSEPGLDRRPGFATAAQLDLVRDLWREWSGADDEAALAAWLERFHHVSALRFLTAAAAGKVITALKAMKRRPSARTEATA